MYEWPVPERAGPGTHEASSALWMYHSHVHEVEDVNAGLVGPLVVTARGKAKADGSPLDVDRELIVAFAEVDENISWYLDENIQSFTANPQVVKKKFGRGPNRQVQGPCDVFEPFCTSNLMASLNGFVFGNMPMLHVRTGSGGVRWYLMSSTNFRDSRAALARQHRPGAAHAHGCHEPAPNGHARGGHDARQSRHVVVSLPCRSAPHGRDAGALHGRAAIGHCPTGACLKSGPFRRHALRIIPDVEWV